MSLWRRLISGIFLLAMLFMAGCAQPPKISGKESTGIWRGRLSLQIESDPAQFFSAGFELAGNAQAGELVLSTPFGGTLAALSWTAQTAVMRANGAARHFDSLDALLTQATGTALPVPALFSWLRGEDAAATGWQADLSQLSQGRLMARRTNPAPVAELRLALEK